MQNKNISRSTVVNALVALGMDTSAINTLLDKAAPSTPAREPGLGRTHSQNQAALRAWGFAGYNRLSEAEALDFYIKIVGEDKGDRPDFASELSDAWVKANPAPEVDRGPSEFLTALHTSGKAGSAKYAAFAAWVERVGKAAARAMTNDERTAAGVAWAKEHGLTAANAFDGCRFARADGSYSISRWARNHDLPNPLT